MSAQRRRSTGHRAWHCLNQHHWLANRLRTDGIAFRQCGNALLTCSDPTRLHQLADALTPRDLDRCAQKWLRAFTPFFTPTERREAVSALLPIDGHDESYDEEEMYRRLNLLRRTGDTYVREQPTIARLVQA